jgi:ribosomal protein S8
MITKLSDIFKKLENQERRKRLVVAAAHDPHVLDAVSIAQKQGVIDAIPSATRRRSGRSPTSTATIFRA